MIKNIKDKVCIVTGSSSGLGRATAQIFAENNAQVVLLSRDNSRGKKALEEIIHSSGNPRVLWIPADLSSQDSVRQFVTIFQDKFARLDVLCNCAGILSLERKTTDEGFELMWATNYLGHFLLTNLLFESLKAAAPSRVVTVSGSGHKPSFWEGWNKAVIDFSDLQGKEKFKFSKDAKQTVLAKILFSYELSRRWKKWNIAACTLCPGLTRTSLINDLPWILRFLMEFRFALQKAQTPREGASHIVELAVGSTFSEINGKYFEGKQKGLKEARSSAESYNQETARRLWDESEKLVKQRFHDDSPAP